MKVVALREAKQTLSGCVDVAQKDRVLITRHGRPAALVVGVEGYDIEDVMLMMNPRFWKMIEESRRRTKSYSLDQVEGYFAVKDKKVVMRKSRG